MKDLEGKTVYLRPTGNNRRRYSAGYVEAIINKVAKVNATFTLKGYVCAEKCKFKGRHLDNGFNGGYNVYETLQEIIDENFVNSLADLIARKYPYSSSYEKLDRETITAVAKLLRVELPEEDE